VIRKREILQMFKVCLFDDAAGVMHGVDQGDLTDLPA
jgi:hypothetical protein